eukprot:Nitzschia sp. Nitz4//scaffold62_size106224//6746//8369//NITZ4_004339-RA/size106224-augustus-gene-0.98-mRNA-1//-1//CDS//3329555805//644//frame0
MLRTNIWSRALRSVVPSSARSSIHPLATSAGSYRFLSSWKVAVVGSGPSGCYTAKYLMSSEWKAENDEEQPKVSIDILERLPTAYGLVRTGVAPDHPEVKNVQNDFNTMMETHKGDIQFYGNVKVGRDVSLEELRQLYDVVVLAYGCDADRSLPVPGAGLEGVLSAREFVAWYNGHVDFEWVGPIVEKALSRGSEVAVLGHGNVALDCARILAKSHDELDPTDIATRALTVLRGKDTPSAPRTISILGRRGHVQGAFTIKELRELTKLPHADFVVDPDELQKGRSTEASQQELKDNRPRTRMDKLLMDAASKVTETDSAKDQVHLRFLVNPVRFDASSDDPSVLGSVVCEKTQLEGEAGAQRAVGTGEEETIDAQLALVSIGYKGTAVEGVEKWFDSSNGTLIHTNGLVDSATGELGGLYTSGWLKRGPSGIIGTNITCARDTVATIVHDAASSSPKADPEQGLGDLLKERGVDVVDWEAYQRIDDYESSDSHKRHPEQPREKLTSVDELLHVALEK